MKGDYAQLLEKMSAEYPTALHLAKVFRTLLVTRCYHLVGVAPEKCRVFLEAYLERFLVEDMKRILRAKHAEKFVDKGSLIPIPRGYDYVNLQSMADAPTFQDSLGFLAKTRFRGVADVIPIYEKYRFISIIEAALEKTYFDLEVRPTIRGLPGQDRIEEMIGVEDDLLNIEVIADLRARRMAVDAVRSLSHAPMNLTQGELGAISAANPDSIPQIISKTRYSALAQPLQDALESGKDESIDHVVRLEIFRRTRSMMVANADTFAYVLGYFREAEAECNNLISMVTGKELGLSEPRIQAAICT
jgi:vacuolar-type H+-ATPase subunit C/Vma6